ncbi:SRPBCC family protein [Segnochrobactrum spirostomi]|uniref:SRPBCC family protein n=1 Tax=Segnochrobactrum spirostomi TaxID=2608987 RepID=A0A6A7XZH6_9HYPH|nr:SRPBCC family protein [Segnochrobactrum spirostomi]MQT12200.1 SRPBCC family protein [Segnochrobactrum spirostomi]
MAADDHDIARSGSAAPYIAPVDPALDLVLEREVPVPVTKVWTAWTTPAHLKHWFVPKPWSISHCEMDLRPGGLFATTMRSPDGTEHPNSGCFLDIVPERRLIFTDTLLPGFRPAPKPFFTAIVEMSPTATGTLYRATAIHGDETTRKAHEDMGFELGWGTVLQQMVDYIRAGSVPG